MLVQLPLFPARHLLGISMSTGHLLSPAEHLSFCWCSSDLPFLNELNCFIPKECYNWHWLVPHTGCHSSVSFMVPVHHVSKFPQVALFLQPVFAALCSWSSDHNIQCVLGSDASPLHTGNFISVSRHSHKTYSWLVFFSWVNQLIPRIPADPWAHNFRHFKI